MELAYPFAGALTRLVAFSGGAFAIVCAWDWACHESGSLLHPHVGSLSRCHRYATCCIKRLNGSFSRSLRLPRFPA